MPLQPITVQLTDGQKMEVLKRYKKRYLDEIAELEVKITEVKTALAEFEFLSKYLGEQPEVVELKKSGERLDKLEARRNHLGMLLDRLDQILPKGEKSGASTIQRY